MKAPLTTRQLKDINQSIGELRKDNQRLLAALKSNGFKECRACGSLDAREFLHPNPTLRVPAHFSFGSKHWCLDCLWSDEMIFDRNDSELDKVLRMEPFDIASSLIPFANTLLDYHHFYNFEGCRDRASKVARMIFEHEERRMAKNMTRFLDSTSPISAWEMFMDALRDTDRYEEVIRILGCMGGRLRGIPHIEAAGPVWNFRCYYVLHRDENLMICNALRHIEQDRMKTTA